MEQLNYGKSTTETHASCNGMRQLKRSVPSTNIQKKRDESVKVRRTQLQHPIEYRSVPMPASVPPQSKSNIFWPTIPYGLENRSILSMGTVPGSSSNFGHDGPLRKAGKIGNASETSQFQKPTKDDALQSVQMPDMAFSFAQTPKAKTSSTSKSHDFTLNFPFVDPALHPFDESDNGWIDEMLSSPNVADIFRHALEDNFCPDVPDLFRLVEDDPVLPSMTLARPAVGTTRRDIMK